MVTYEGLEYDFVDFGASTGGCIDFGCRKLGGVRGLGIDLDPVKVERMRSTGYACILGDVTALDLPAGSVRFVTMSHVLEHLPSLDAVGLALAEAARIATDFIFIQGPYFDADDYLAELGLKFYWSDWHGHPCHLTTTQLKTLLAPLPFDDVRMMLRQPVIDSSDPCIHPVASPPDQHEYNPAAHPPKPQVKFKRGWFRKARLYREFVCFARRRDLEQWDDIITTRSGCIPLAEARTP